MKKTTITLLLLFFFSNLFAKDIKVTISNKTNQLITSIDYWFGSATEANGANLNFLSKGTLQNDVVISFPLDFHKTKRNTILVRGYLTGGGYVSQKYSISEGENPTITLYNLAVPVKTQEFTDVINKFSSLKLTNGEYKPSEQNALDALIGSIFIYSDSINVVYKLLPSVLKTRSRKLDVPTLSRKITGVFSSETSINSTLSLPFVSASTSFESGDVAKFTWEIEDVGEYNWFSEDGKDLATLFASLNNDTKKILIDLYEKYPNAKMKFIDKAFVLGRLEVTTLKSKKISNNIELNGANYVTASGNYAFVDEMQDKFVLKNVITQIDGYDATILLSSLYLEHKIQKMAVLTAAENERIKSEYDFLRKQYPDILAETTDVNIMKKALSNMTKNTNSKIIFTDNALKGQQINVKSIQ
jgi:hypothetical protein